MDSTQTIAALQSVIDQLAANKAAQTDQMADDALHNNCALTHCQLAMNMLTAPALVAAVMTR